MTSMGEIMIAGCNQFKTASESVYMPSANHIMIKSWYFKTTGASY